LQARAQQQDEQQQQQSTAAAAAFNHILSAFGTLN
jgi:hypothetical protein